ncbi:MAG: hypothetical protein AAB622_03185 [Patescibacteria group bacterium]
MEIPNPNLIKADMMRWSELLRENADVAKFPDKHAVKAFIEISGGKPEAVVGHETSMKMWSVLGNAEAMSSIWGKRWEEFQDFNEGFINDYLKKDGPAIHLGKIPIRKKGDKEKIVGYSRQHHMKRILCVLTRWGVFSNDQDPEFGKDRFVYEIATRVENGRLMLKGEKPKVIDRPDTKEKYIAYVPIEYIPAMINWLISSTQK